MTPQPGDGEEFPREPRRAEPSDSPSRAAAGLAGCCPPSGGPGDWPYLAVILAFMALLTAVGLGLLTSGASEGSPPQARAFDPEEFERWVIAKVESRPDLHPLLLASGVFQYTLIAVGLLALGFVAWRMLRRRPWPAPEMPPGHRSPPERARWTVRELALALIAMLVAPILIVPLAAGSLSPVGQLVLGMAINAGVALFAFQLVGGQGQGAAELGLPGPTPIRAAGAGLALYLAVWPIVYGGKYIGAELGRLLGRPPAVNPAAEIFLLTDSTRDVLIVAAIAVLAAPAIEEIFFRGFAYPALRSRFGAWPAMAASAALFAAVHPTIYDMPPIFFLGVALAYAYERTGSLAAPLALHFANNLVAVAQMSVLRYVARA